MTQRDSGRQWLAEHAEECADCQAEPLPVERLSMLLEQGELAVNSDELSQQTLLQLRPELQANASEALERRMVKALLVSTVPLALVLGYNMLVLEIFHGFLLRFLPPGLATYIVFSYFALISLLFAATYAAVPLLLARRSAPQGLAC